MKHFSPRTVFFAIAFFGATASAYAQATTHPPLPPATPKPRGINYQIASVGNPIILNSLSDTTLQKKIKLDIKGKNAIDALKKVAEQAEVEVVIDKDVTSNRKITIQADDVTVQSALNTISTLEGLRWRFVNNTNGKKQIQIVRSTNPSVFTTYNYSQINDMVRDRITSAQQIGRTRDGLTIFRAATLPDTRVKIDVRNTDVRDILKSVLAQANLPYALEDDLPTEEKRSFTFENIPVSLALDIITTSIGVGWSAERQASTSKSGADATPGTPTSALPLVRVGKKYIGSNRLFRYVSPATTVSVTTTTETSHTKTEEPVPPVPATAP